MEKTANDDEPAGIECGVIEVKDRPGRYLVEAINHGSEGEVYRAIFDGQDALPRAMAYAAWAYGHNGILMPPQTYLHQPRVKPKLTVVRVADTSERQPQIPGETIA